VYRGDKHRHLIAIHRESQDEPLEALRTAPCAGVVVAAMKKALTTRPSALKSPLGRATVVLRSLPLGKQAFDSWASLLNHRLRTKSRFKCMQPAREVWGQQHGSLVVA